MIQGPPGTGKTTVIAAITSLNHSSDRTNCMGCSAVKHVAEKLADVGFLDFKILVSKEFHFDWYFAGGPQRPLEKRAFNRIMAELFNMREEATATGIAEILIWKIFPDSYDAQRSKLESALKGSTYSTLIPFKNSLPLANEAD
ncbi:hypothetical protein C0991_011847 [Blastosporella zonata]|nr:hypothetical protein C0991_011847 [Blastosporella zonata]